MTSVNFTSNNTSIAAVSPSSDSSSAYNTTATGQSAGSTTIRAGVIMASSERCSDTANITVTPPKAWWQVQDADVVTNGNLISVVPGTANTTFILNGLGGFPGVAIYGGSIADFSAGSGTGAVSSKGWLGNASTVAQKNYSYRYFEALIPSDIVFNEITSTSVTGAKLTSGTPSRGYYWNRFDGTTGSTLNQDLTIIGNSDFGTKKVILLVTGANLNIEGRINITDGSGTFVTIVGKNESGGKGNIVIDPNAGSAAGVDLEGIYFADSQFKTGAGNSQLYIRGSVAAYDGLVLERDLADNSSTPAEFFEYGLDQILLYPPSLSVRKIRWKEVAP